MDATLVASRPDPASVNIRDRLLELAHWTEAGMFAGLPVRRHEASGALLVEIPGVHLEHERLDAELARAGLPAAALCFLSKHRSDAGHDALTVHPLGNFDEAAFGGEAGVVCPAAPALQSELLRILHERARRERPGLPVTFEATHHGPRLDVPAFFVEIGSAEANWRDPALGRLVAEAVLDLLARRAEPRGACIGLGGGHYAPRHGDLARSGRADVGHIVPGHHLKALRRRPGLVAHLLERSGGATAYHLDPRGTGEEAWATVIGELDAAGLRRVP